MSSGGRQAAAERVAATGGVAHQVRQHVLEVVLVQRHALQQVVEQLSRHCGVDARAAGHEHVDLVHALDVASGEPLAGFPVQGVRFCRGKEEQSCEKKMKKLHCTTKRRCSLVGWCTFAPGQKSSSKVTTAAGGVNDSMSPQLPNLASQRLAKPHEKKQKLVVLVVPLMQRVTHAPAGLPAALSDCI